MTEPVRKAVDGEVLVRGVLALALLTGPLLTATRLNLVDRWVLAGAAILAAWYVRHRLTSEPSATFLDYGPGLMLAGMAALFGALFLAVFPLLGIVPAGVFVLNAWRIWAGSPDPLPRAMELLSPEEQRRLLMLRAWSLGILITASALTGLCLFRMIA